MATRRRGAPPIERTPVSVVQRKYKPWQEKMLHENYRYFDEKSNEWLVFSTKADMEKYRRQQSAKAAANTSAVVTRPPTATVTPVTTTTTPAVPTVSALGRSSTASLLRPVSNLASTAATPVPPTPTPATSTAIIPPIIPRTALPPAPSTAAITPPAVTSAQTPPLPIIVAPPPPPRMLPRAPTPVTGAVRPAPPPTAASQNPQWSIKELIDEDEADPTEVQRKLDMIQRTNVLGRSRDPYESTTTYRVPNFRSADKKMPMLQFVKDIINDGDSWYMNEINQLPFIRQRITNEALTKQQFETLAGQKEALPALFDENGKQVLPPISMQSLSPQKMDELAWYTLHERNQKEPSHFFPMDQYGRVRLNYDNEDFRNAAYHFHNWYRDWALKNYGFVPDMEGRTEIGDAKFQMIHSILTPQGQLKSLPDADSQSYVQNLIELMEKVRNQVIKDNGLRVAIALPVGAAGAANIPIPTPDAADAAASDAVGAVAEPNPNNQQVIGSTSAQPAGIYEQPSEIIGDSSDPTSSTISFPTATATGVVVDDVENLDVADAGHDSAHQTALPNAITSSPDNIAPQVVDRDSLAAADRLEIMASNTDDVQQSKEFLDRAQQLRDLAFKPGELSFNASDDQNVLTTDKFAPTGLPTNNSSATYLHAPNSSFQSGNALDETAFNEFNKRRSTDPNVVGPSSGLSDSFGVVQQLPINALSSNDPPTGNIMPPNAAQIDANVNSERAAAASAGEEADYAELMAASRADAEEQKRRQLETMRARYKLFQAVWNGIIKQINLSTIESLSKAIAAVEQAREFINAGVERVQTINDSLRRSANDLASMLGTEQEYQFRMQMYAQYEDAFFELTSNRIEELSEEQVNGQNRKIANILCYSSMKTRLQDLLQTREMMEVRERQNLMTTMYSPVEVAGPTIGEAERGLSAERNQEGATLRMVQRGRTRLETERQQVSAGKRRVLPATPGSTYGTPQQGSQGAQTLTGNYSDFNTGAAVQPIPGQLSFNERLKQAAMPEIEQGEAEINAAESAAQQATLQENQQEIIVPQGSAGTNAALMSTSNPLGSAAAESQLQQGVVVVSATDAQPPESVSQKRELQIEGLSAQPMEEEQVFEAEPQLPVGAQDVSPTGLPKRVPTGYSTFYEGMSRFSYFTKIVNKDPKAKESGYRDAWGKFARTQNISFDYSKTGELKGAKWNGTGISAQAEAFVADFRKSTFYRNL